MPLQNNITHLIKKKKNSLKRSELIVSLWRLHTVNHQKSCELIVTLCEMSLLKWQCMKDFNLNLSSTT